MKRFSILAMLIVAFFTTIAQNPGELDPSFGTNGTQMFAPAGSSFVQGFAMCQMPDGRFLTAGRTRVSNSWQVYVSRHNNDGSLDNTFGQNGIAIFNPTNYIHYAYDVAYDAELEHIVVLGYCYNSALSVPYPFLMCLNEDGSLCNDFAGNGFSMINDGHPMVPRHMAIHEEMIYWGGYRDDLACIARFYPDGNLDTSFGNGGYSVFLNENESGISNVEDIAIQPDGKVIAGSWFIHDGNEYDCCVARLNNDGSLDDSFGEGGYCKFDINNNIDFLLSVTMQDDGKIVTGCHYGIFDPVVTTRYGVAAARITTDGQLDNSFGEGGLAKVEYILGQNYCNGVVVGEDGQVFLGCYCIAYDTGKQLMFVTNFTADGQLNTDFGLNGYTTFGSTNEGAENECHDILMQPDGMVVAFGHEFHNGIMARMYSGVITETEENTVDGMLSVYPNPVVDMLYFDMQGTAMVYDIMGRQVLRNDVNGSLNVANLPQGTYFIEVIGENETLKARFVK